MPVRLLENKRALVLGANGGIGSEITKLLVSEGCKVIGIGKDEFEPRKFKELENGENIFNHFILDIQNKEQVYNIIRVIFDEFDGVNFIVNAMGRYRMDVFTEIPFEAYEEIIQTNLTSTVYFYYTFLKELKRRLKEGRANLTRLDHVIDIISLIHIVLAGGDAVAAASKAGLMTFSLVLNKEQEVMKNHTNPKIKEEYEILKDIRFSRIYPQDVDTNIYEPSKDNLLIPVDSFKKFPPSLVAREVLNLLANSEYKNFNDVSIRLFGKEVFALLHSLTDSGMPEFSRAMKKIKLYEI